MNRIAKHIICLCCMCMPMPYLQPEDWFDSTFLNRFSKPFGQLPKGFFSIWLLFFLIYWTLLSRKTEGSGPKTSWQPSCTHNLCEGKVPPPAPVSGERWEMRSFAINREPFYQASSEIFSPHRRRSRERLFYLQWIINTNWHKKCDQLSISIKSPKITAPN